ncbi:MAG TPA: CotH kinase family protein [bacterium]|nr:CotH kinase family protein [bacterium]HPN44114.1 CotH kinase family protein [bacterium]
MKININLSACIIWVCGLLSGLANGTGAVSWSKNNTANLLTNKSCPAVQFSQPGGFYNASQTLQLSVDETCPGLTIYFTCDGSEPDTTDDQYQAPLTLDTTTVIRARACAPGYNPGPVVTQTLFINEECTLPIVSLATDPYNLWDEDYGIYVTGKHAQSEIPHYGANYWMDWERPAHIEFFEPGADTAAFALNVGIKIFGGWSRMHAQKSLAFFARKQYDERDIDYKIFPDREITRFEAFVMRNSGNDWQYTMLRDGFMQSLLVGEMDLETLAFRPAVLFLNGQYWGILNLREKVNDRYLQAHKNIDPDYIDLLELTPSGPAPVVLQGSSEHYRQMIDYVTKTDMSVNAALKYINTQMDVENFIHYMLAEIYFANIDWPSNNIKFWRPSLDGGRWRWIIYDTDFGFGLYDANSYTHNTLEFATAVDGPSYPNSPYSTLLLRKLLENELFRAEFINQFADHLNTTFDSNRINNMLDYYISLIQPELSRHRQRWPESAQVWYYSIDVMRNFANTRSWPMRQFIQEKFSLRGTYYLYLVVKGSTASRIQVNSHQLTTFPWEGVYFLDVPVTLTAIPEPGYIFTGWSGGITSADPTIIYPSTQNVTLKAHFAPSPQQNKTIVINEINYNSNKLMDSQDWIEFYNYSAESIDLAGWIFRDSNDAHEFIFPKGSFIPAMGYLVLCHDTLDFKRVHSGMINIAGNMDFNISNDGELLRLYDPNLALIDSVFFTNGSPWPTGADGAGYTLELTDPLADNSQPLNWQVSSEFGGSPGADNIRSLAVHEQEGRCNTFMLLQNYPNPFNAVTRIQYTLTETSLVTLKIYDIRGRLVDQIVTVQQSPGLHTINWSCNLASGIYYYRLEAYGARNRYTAVKKMVFIK